MEINKNFMIFPHNLTCCGTLANLLKAIMDLEHIPSNVDNWLAHFPQAKPQFQGRDITQWHWLDIAPHYQNL